MKKHGVEEQFLTEKEYAATYGTKCPSCRSDAIEGGSFSTEAGVAWQEVTCLICAASWTDLYTLTGYSNLELDHE